MPSKLIPWGKTDEWNSFKVVIKINETTPAFMPRRE